MHRHSLGVTREHRAAMLSNMAASLITHDRIKTTLTKAKALRPFVEKIITKAKNAAAKTEVKDALHLRRLAHSDLRDEDALTLLFNESTSSLLTVLVVTPASTSSAHVKATPAQWP